MKVHAVKKSRKAYPQYGIKKGDTYYWWKFRFGGIQKSKTYPKQSQLTRSEFLSAVYTLQEEMEGTETIDQSTIDDWISQIEFLRDECQDKLDNMPEQLQESSSSGQMLQERIDGLEQWISDLEDIEIPDEDSIRSEVSAETEDKEEIEQEVQERLDEIKNEVLNANPGF